nr:hypothetical protein [Pandoravirus massiliensis]
MNPHSPYRICDGTVYCASPDDDARLDRMPPEAISIIVSHVSFAMLTRLLDGPRCLRNAAIDEIHRRLCQAGYGDQMGSEWPTEAHIVAREWIDERIRDRGYDPSDYYKLAKRGAARLRRKATIKPDPSVLKATAAERATITALRDRRRPNPIEGALPIGHGTWKTISHRRSQAPADTFLGRAIALAQGDIGSLIIKNLAPDQRRALHLLAEDLGFDHETISHRMTLRHARKVPNEFRRRFEDGQYGYGESGCRESSCGEGSACNPYYKRWLGDWEWSQQDRHSWWHCEMGDMEFKYRRATIKSKAIVIVATRGVIRVPPLDPPPP